MKLKTSRSWSSSFSPNVIATMAAPRTVININDVKRLRDEENAKVGEDSPTTKKPVGPKLEGKFPLSRWELAAFVGVFVMFSLGLFGVYWTMPAADFGKIRLPRSLSDLRMLKDLVATYADDHPAQFILGYCSIYIFMQTFMIPGTIFMSLLAGALFGVIRGLLLVVFNATAGASSCFFLSKLIGRPLVGWLWPEKLKFFQAEIAKRREKLLNYMLFLRITPTLPNLFINLASPIVDIPFHIFFLATAIGLIPASYITVRAGLALGDLKSVKDLYDFKTLMVLFLIGSVSILPTLLKKKRTYE
ncbi:SNARE associated Golgi protein [Dillenia turbinata]|uniref:SNARE associated Golgi protein n=1 Tax=Dillenia turbinata TaxID=194707 RepID=A0AAN8ZHV9_9MAGN